MTLRWPAKLSLISSLLFMQLLIDQMAYSAVKFQVREIGGRVEYLPPFAILWRDAKLGTVLAEDTLIRVHDGAMVKIASSLRRNPAWRGIGNVLQFNESIQVRLSANVLRDVALQRTYAEGVRPPKSDAVLIEPEYDLMAAWEKLVNIVRVSSGNAFTVLGLYAKAQQPVQAGVQSRKIKIVAPQHGAARYVLNFPFNLRIDWLKPRGHKGAFDVFLWPASGSMTKALDRTTATNYKVSIVKEGSYYLQIMSADRRYASEAHLIHVGTPTGAELGLQDPAALEAQSPPVRFAVVADKKQTASVTFSWANSAVVTDNVMLHIQRAENFGQDGELGRKGKLEVESAPLERVRMLRIKPGHYYWWLTSSIQRPTGEGKKEYKTTLRELRVFDHKRRGDYAYLVKNSRGYRLMID